MLVQNLRMVCKKCADEHKLTMPYTFLIGTRDCETCVCKDNYECEKCSTVYDIKYQVNEMNDKCMFSVIVLTVMAYL